MISPLVLTAKLSWSLIFTLVFSISFERVLFEKKTLFTCREDTHFIKEKCVQRTKADLKGFSSQHSEEIPLTTLKRKPSEFVRKSTEWTPQLLFVFISGLSFGIGDFSFSRALVYLEHGVGERGSRARL